MMHEASLAMTSSRVIAEPFAYLEPTTKGEALALLDRHQSEGIRVLAGGTDLLVRLKTGAPAPAYLLSIGRVAELGRLSTAGGLVIGAGASLRQVETAAAVQSDYPALYAALSSMAGPAIRFMGTVAGNLCNASPAADTAVALLALGAACTLESPAGQRQVPLAEFFVGPGKTVLAPAELLTEIVVPPAMPGSGSAFVKIARVSGDIAKVSAAVYVERDGRICSRCRIALGAVAATPLRITAAEAVVAGAAFDHEVAAAAARAAAEAINPIDDIRSTAAYRRRMAQVLVEELLPRAWQRAGGEDRK